MTNTTNTERTTAEILAGLQTYVAALNALMASYFSRVFPTLEVPTISVKVCRKYAKVIKTNFGSRSSYSYVDLTTGDVVKGNWKGVESAVLHIKRGNVCDGSWLAWHGPYGIGYADAHGEFASMLSAEVIAVAKDAVMSNADAAVAELLSRAIAERIEAQRAARAEKAAA